MLAREAMLKAGATPPELDMAKIDQIVMERYKSTDGKTRYKPDVKRKAALLTQK